MQRMSIIAMVIGILLVAAGGTMAAEAEKAKQSGISLELNSLKSVGSGCRIAFVIHNGYEVAISDLGFELVLFDKNQFVTTVLSVKAGALPRSKTRVKQFDIGKVDCGNVGRILLNDFDQCKGEGLDAPACLKSVKLTSRAGIPFDF
jgi:hypothetical protein